MNWTTLRKLLALLLAAGGVTISISVNIEINVNEPPVPASELGWAGPEAVAEAQALVAEMPPFVIVGAAEDNSSKNVRLWDFARWANGGAHLPNYPQEIGDCVSFGAKNAIEYLQAVQIYFEGKTHEFRRIYPPYIYGISRVQIGKGRVSGDGSVGAWAARGVQEYGVLAADAEGVPKYSGSIARQWGKSGPPEALIKVAREFPVKTVALVKSAADIRDAICNGYPVTIASNFGTKTIRERDGRMVAKWDGSWAHQMTIVGYDGRLTEKYFYVLNSWGASAHPKPLQDEPPGGFWITFSDADRIAKQNDSFAFSSFAGFPANDAIDFTIIGDDEARAGVPRQQSIANNFTQEAMAMWTLVGLVMVILAIMVWPKKSKTCKHLAALLACLCAGTAHGEELQFDVFAPVVGSSNVVAQNADGKDFDLFCGCKAGEESVCFDLFCLTDPPVTRKQVDPGYAVTTQGFRRSWTDRDGRYWWIDHLPSNEQVIRGLDGQPRFVWRDGRVHELVERQPAKIAGRYEWFVVNCADGTCKRELRWVE